MLDPLKILNGIKNYIGIYSFLMIVIACIIGGFAKQFGEISIGTLSNPIAIISEISLFIGVILGLINVFSVIFISRPARGLIDGLLAGMLASLFGGLSGFGLHLDDQSYIDPFYVRAFYCAVFTVPSSAVFGLLFDLFQADRNISWGKYFSVLCVVIIISLTITLTTIVYFMPTMEGNGISISDIQLLFETFMFFFISISALQFKWRYSEIIKAMSIFAVGVLCLRLFTSNYPWHLEIPELNWRCERLSCFTMSDADYDQVILVTTLILLSIWSIITYAIIAKINSAAIFRLNKKSTRLHDI